MSILKREEDDDDIQMDAKFVAERLTKATKKVYQMLVSLFNDTSTMFWLNQQGFSPQQIADALGKDGKELFEIHNKLAQFLSSFDSQDIELGLAIVGEYEINEDGSIKILESITDSEEEPAASTEEPAASTEEPAASTEEPAASTEGRILPDSPLHGSDSLRFVKTDNN